MNLKLVPHTDILNIPSNELEGMTIVSKMQMIKDIAGHIRIIQMTKFLQLKKIVLNKQKKLE